MSRRQPSDPPTVLALVPSDGLGGGIETYARAVLEQLVAGGASVERLALTTTPGSGRVTYRAKIEFAVRALRSARRLGQDQKVVVVSFASGFSGLLLACDWMAGRKSHPVIFLYGSEIWSARPHTRRLWRSRRIRRLTISSFSAGALAADGPTAILPPSVPAGLFTKLLDIERGSRELGHVLSVFRLADAEGKGAYTLIEAVEAARAIGELHLTLAGVGPATPEFRGDAARHPWISIVESPSEDVLVQLYERADVFVLATRLRGRPSPCGEGFGIVLVEAALAGLPVVAPSHGGSHDAYIDGVTGLRPTDEGAPALSATLATLCRDKGLTRRLGVNGRAWARESCDPARYKGQVWAALFEGGPAPPTSLRLVRGGEQG